VAAVGAVRSGAGGRALRWARENPWRFAVAPALACAAVVFALSVTLGGAGFFGGVFSALWHAAIAYGLTGAAGSIGRSRRKTI
jgi:hypothetical protein